MDELKSWIEGLFRNLTRRISDLETIVNNADLTEIPTVSTPAPTNAQYVTLALNGTLTDERVLTAGANIGLTDGGAGSTITVAVTGLDSGDISDFTEAAQDAVGGALTDTNSVDLTYTDASNQITADVRIQDTTSVDLAIDAGGLKATVLPAGVDHNSLGGKQGGTTSEYYHLTATELNQITYGKIFQVKDPLLACRFDGPKPYETDYTGVSTGHFGQLSTVAGGLIFRPGKFGKGAQLAAAETNIIINPSFEVNVTTGWTIAGTGATRNQDTSRAYIGAASCRLTAATSGSAYIHPSVITVANGASIAVQARIYRDSAISSSLILRDTTNSLTRATATPAVTGSWELLYVTWTNTTGGAVNIDARIINSAGNGSSNIWIDAVCMTDKAYLTPYLDGTLGAGHVWTGPAHASTSNRTAASLRYTNPLLATAGTIAFWWNPAADQTGADRYLFSEGNLKAYFQASDDKIYFTDGTNTISSAALTFSASTWMHLAFTWSSAGLAVVQNGASIASGATYTAPALGVNLYIGSDTSAANQCDGLIDDLVILDRALVTNEAKAIYTSDAPVYVLGVHNYNLGLQGGTTGEYYHFSSANYTDLTDGGDSTLHYHASDRAYSDERWIDIARDGFIDNTQTSIGFNDGTYVFTLTDAGAGWKYMRGGMIYSITGNKTVTLPGTPPATGFYYIYIDANDGTLTQSTSAWTLLDQKVEVATISWNNSLTPKYQLADERHTCLIDSRMHYYLHNTLGSRYLNGGTLSGYSVAPVTPGDTDNTFAISQVTVADEDLIETLSALADPNGTATDYVVFFRTSLTAWSWEASAMPYRYTAAGYIQYDNAGTMTQGGTAKYYNSYLIFSNFQGAARFVIIPGRAEFSSLATAQAESPTGFDFTGYPSNEGVIAYQLTWDTSAAFGTKGKARLAVAPKRINAGIASPATSGAGVDHNTLSGLQGGLSPSEFYHLTAAQIAALHAAITIDVNADTILSLTGQQLGLDTQAANRFLGGPTSGAAAAPTVRALVADDLPAASEAAKGAIPIATRTETDEGNSLTHAVVPTYLLTAACVSHPLKVTNTSGATAEVYDVGYVIYVAGSGLEYKTSTTANDNRVAEAVVVMIGGVDTTDIYVTRTGWTLVKCTGSVAAGGFLVFSTTAGAVASNGTAMRPEVIAVAQAADSGGYVYAMLLCYTAPATISLTNDIYQGSGLSDSDFVSIIASLPGGAPTTLTYGAVSSGAAANLVPFSTSQAAKMVLHNTTRGTDALISNCVTGTSTITLTANVPAGWQVNDAITIRSQTNTSTVGGGYFVDFEITDTGVPKLTRAVGLELTWGDSGGAGQLCRLHPYETNNNSRRKGENTQSTTNIIADKTIPIIQNRFCVAWDASGSGTAFLLLRLNEANIAAP